MRPEGAFVPTKQDPADVLGRLELDLYSCACTTFCSPLCSSIRVSPGNLVRLVRPIILWPFTDLNLVQNVTLIRHCHMNDCHMLRWVREYMTWSSSHLNTTCLSVAVAWLSLSIWGLGSMIPVTQERIASSAKFFFVFRIEPVVCFSIFGHMCRWKPRSLVTWTPSISMG